MVDDIIYITIYFTQGETMETKIARADFEDDRRVIAISNIHGYLGFLKRVLKKVNYSPYKDILVINGNMIEKGPHSLQTLRYISQLSDDGDVYLVMGNAEAIQLMFLSDDTPSGDDKIFRYIVSRRITGRSCLLSEMFFEMNVPIESVRDIQRYKAELKKRYMPEIMFLNSMPTILETKNLIFVHGGIPNEDLDNFEKVDAMQFLKRDAYLEHCKYEFSKYVITGGWPSHLYSSKIQSQRPIIDRARKIVSIAGGAGYKFDGQVNALIINDAVRGNFGYAYEDGFQEAIALSPQKASTDSINIRRTSNFIRILEPGAEFSYILHRASGKKLFIYNRYLHSDNEFTTCEDYTDYQLEVKTGDRLGVLFETSKGYLVKRNGITGWYQGEIELLPREEIITRDELLSMHQGTQIIVDDASPKYNENLKYELVTEETSIDPEIDIPLDIVTQTKTVEQPKEEKVIEEEKIISAEIKADTETENTENLDAEENNLELESEDDAYSDEPEEEDIVLSEDGLSEIQEEPETEEESSEGESETEENEIEEMSEENVEDEEDELYVEGELVEIIEDDNADSEPSYEETAEPEKETSEFEEEKLDDEIDEPEEALSDDEATESEVTEDIEDDAEIETSENESLGEEPTETGEDTETSETDEQETKVSDEEPENDDSESEEQLKAQKKEDYDKKMLDNIIQIYQDQIENNKYENAEYEDQGERTSLTEQLKKMNSEQKKQEQKENKRSFFGLFRKKDR